MTKNVIDYYYTDDLEKYHRKMLQINLILGIGVKFLKY